MPRNQRIEMLKSGQAIIGSSAGGGNSMIPLIHPGDRIDIYPAQVDKIEPGDIVYVRVRGNTYTHRVVGAREDQVQIANAKGHVNGWTPRHQVYGIVTAINGVERSGAKEKVKLFCV